ncbi:MAG: hypothetical protein HY348_07350 [Nitrospira defluvii]|nr:hypothetical protein [Nitrospira defluvii]
MKIMDAAQENRVRRLANRLNYQVTKSRQVIHMNNRGKYRLVNDSNWVVMGVDFDASLDQIEEYLRNKEKSWANVEYVDQPAKG